jgi:hypothetical protein
MSQTVGAPPLCASPCTRRRSLFHAASASSPAASAGTRPGRFIEPHAHTPRGARPGPLSRDPSGRLSPTPNGTAWPLSKWRRDSAAGRQMSRLA